MNKFIIIFWILAVILSTVASLVSCYFLFKIHDNLKGNDIIKLERYKE